MTLSKSSFYMDKRHSISRTFSWLPSPSTNNTKEDRHRTNVPFLNTHMNFTTPTLSLSPSSVSSPATTTSTPKKLGFFSKFKSSSTELEQALCSSDEEEEEERHLPRTPRDSQQLSSSSSPITLKATSSSITLPTIPTSSTSLPAKARARTSTTEPILTTTIATDKPQVTLPAPHPPQHASLSQYIQNVLASTFDDVDKTIEKEWDQDRRRLEIDLLTPAPFQYS